jgi:hypothetical protein
MLKEPVLFGLLPAAVIATALVLSPLEVVTEAQQQAPASPAPAATGRVGGPGLGGAVGYALSGERAYERMVDEAEAKGLPIPPRTMGMEVYSGGQVEGRQPVRDLGGAR